MAGAATTEVTDLRVLEGPNIYFTRPAIKLELAVPGWLNASEARVRAAAERLGISGARTPGRAGTEQRRRTVMRIAGAYTRRAAIAGGARRLALRARPGARSDRIVVAFPWRHRDAAIARARETAAGMEAMLRGRSPSRLAAEAGRRLETVAPGAAPGVPDPALPVIQVTGTNGKTTTVRLLAHLVRSSGLTVAYSSTDGVFRGDAELVEAGDYSGFGGAGKAMAESPDVAVLETARGGMLLRGCGVRHNDVAVVTNVTADHLGLNGVDTVDQLAEVKAVITRITRPDGWDVLNADDPRVLAMRRHATGRPWLFSLHAGHPALREALADGGRAMTVMDGRMTWLEGHASHPLARLLDIPITVAGLSSVYTQNAMAAAAAALAIGLPAPAVARGLRTFMLDPERNPGRANLFRLDGRIVVIDYAHNEAGMIGLTEILQGLCAGGHETWIAICTAGDRTDEILHGFALRAALGSDHLAIAELLHYLRGRGREEIIEQLRAGAREAGVDDVPAYEDELHALRAMVHGSSRGDVISVTALGMRPEIFAWLASVGAERLTPAQVRRIAARAAASRS
jgi:cyanophycin synthetase